MATGRLRRLQEHIGWPVLVQKQEAYLLPKVHSLQTFSDQHFTGSCLCLLWTPGPTPGNCVAHISSPYNILFCGRLLTPLRPGKIGPLRNGRTFHWHPQLESLTRLRSWIPSDASPELALGAELGALGGEYLVTFSGCAIDAMPC